MKCKKNQGNFQQLPFSTRMSNMMSIASVTAAYLLLQKCYKTEARNK